MAPAFAQFEQKYGKKITIISVNSDDADLSAKMKPYKKSQYIPETVVLRDGKVVEQKVGALSLPQLEQLMKKGSP
ncbi:MAG: thioredoxin [Proteobacteria bacterium]|jgi:thiol-disulfide isomerase/thioredoxin|nr:thioredoxin [Pseudomonadota bacterium]